MLLNLMDEIPKMGALKKTTLRHAPATSESTSSAGNKTRRAAAIQRKQKASGRQ